MCLANCMRHFRLTIHFPASTQRSINSESTLIQRHDVESTLIQCCFNVIDYGMCLMHVHVVRGRKRCFNKCKRPKTYIFDIKRLPSHSHVGQPFALILYPSRQVLSQVGDVHDGPTVVTDSEALLTGASADNTVDPEVLSILSTDAIVESLVDSEELFTGVAVESMADSVILLEKRAGMAGSNVLFADPAVKRVTGSEKVLLGASFESGESPADSAVIFSVLELAELAEIVGIRFELVDLPVDEAGLVISAEVRVMAILESAAVMFVLFLFWFSISVILSFDKLSAGLPCLAVETTVSFCVTSLVFSVLV